MKLKEGMVINCRTKQKALEFLKECCKQGIFSGSGRPIGNIIDDWNDFKQDTCYAIYSNSTFRYCNVKYYLNKGFKVINFDDLFKEEKKMSKCKIYEMPDYVCNEVKKVIINEPCVIVILNSGEKGVAKCCPEDEFIESRGFDIAYHRAIIKRLENNAKHMKHNLKIIVQ